MAGMRKAGIVSIAGIAVVVLLGLLGLTLWGCGNEDSGTPESAETGPEAVSLQLQWVTQAQFAGYYMALEKGWYLEEGIDLTIHPGGPDIVPVDLVAAGTRDFGTTLLADLAAKIGAGKPVISIAQIQQNNGLRMLTRRSSGIRTPEDFMGKRVGVWLGGWEVQFNALLALKKISPGQMDVVSQGFSMGPFIEGRLDVASAMLYNEYHMVLDSGIAPEELVVFDFDAFGLGFPGDVLFVSRSVTEARPDLCRKMVRASLRGWRHALDHQAEAVQAVLDHDRSGIATLAHQQKMMAEVAKLVRGEGSTPMGQLDVGTLEQLLLLLETHQILPAPVPAVKIFDPQFISNSGT